LPVPAALQHPLREDLFRLIREKPGIHESQLARDLGLRHTHVQYHLRVLEEAGLVELRRYAGLKCAFEMGKHSSEEKDMLLAGRGRVRHVLNVVLAEPGLSQRALAHRLGMSESSVKWHLDRLQGAGLVRTERCDGAKLAWPAKQGPDSSG
jgi:predicted transcriptional regulator